MPRFTTLYSGSSGNSGIAEEDGRFLMIDMGASCRTTVAALTELELSVNQLGGILVTHEHSDHIKGLKVFLKKNPVPVYASEATLNALRCMDAVQPDTHLVAIDSAPINILGFTVYGFATSHDSAGCCGFHITTPSGSTMAIATDLGVITQEVFSHLQSAQLVALEANYDIEQLRMGPYPYYLKKRISSSRGHLSNDDSAAAIARLIANGCRRVALCHLSQENNHPNLVLNSLDSALFSEGVQLPEDCVIQISRRYQASPWINF